MWAWQIEGSTATEGTITTTAIPTIDIVTIRIVNRPRSPEPEAQKGPVVRRIPHAFFCTFCLAGFQQTLKFLHFRRIRNLCFPTT